MEKIETLNYKIGEWLGEVEGLFNTNDTLQEEIFDLRDLEEGVIATERDVEIIRLLQTHMLKLSFILRGNPDIDKLLTFLKSC